MKIALILSVFLLSTPYAMAKQNQSTRAQDVEDGGGFTQPYYIEGNYAKGQDPRAIEPTPDQESAFLDELQQLFSDRQWNGNDLDPLFHLAGGIQRVCAVETKTCDVEPYKDNIQIYVDRNGNQMGESMTVVADGVVLYQSMVSTGGRGHITPPGVFPLITANAGRIHYTRNHCSGVAAWGRAHKGAVYLAPMPYSVHFNGGIALHGGERVNGAPLSHGCVRLPMWAARQTYCLLLSHENWKRTVVHVL